MSELKELTSSELSEINGGASFAYRAGQALALMSYAATGVPTYGSVKAAEDWGLL